MVEVKLTNSSGFGGDPYAGPWDDLPLPGEGRTIGNTVDVQILRRIFSRMGIEAAHRDGKNILCERYHPRRKDLDASLRPSEEASKDQLRPLSLHLTC